MVYSLYGGQMNIIKDIDKKNKIVWAIKLTSKAFDSFKKAGYTIIF